MAKVVTCVALAVLATPVAAETRLGGGYMMSRPVSGDTGGADHALVLHGERVLRPDIAAGVTVEAGYTPGNDEETLKRLAILPTLVVRGDVGALRIGADLALGWQLLDGRTRLGTVPVAGTEARGLRGELALAADAPVNERVMVRARVGLVIDAVFPAQTTASNRLGPVVELAILGAL